MYFHIPHAHRNSRWSNLLYLPHHQHDVVKENVRRTYNLLLVANVQPSDDLKLLKHC